MPAQSFPAKPELRQLQFRLAATRVRLVSVQVGAGIASALALALGGLAFEMTLDALVHLPWLARACLILPVLGVAGWIAYREAFLALWKMPCEHAVACAIERALPVFQTRLIASIQLGRDAGSRKNALVSALIRETAAMSANQDFRKAVRMGALVRNARILACVLATVGVLAWLGRSNDILLLERAFLLTTRLPTRTRIEKIEAPSKIAAGEDLNITVQAAGVLPAQGLVLTQAGPHASEYPLTRDSAAPGRYRAVIRSVPDSLSFRISLNDCLGDPFSVRVLTPPAVLAIKAIEAFPPYTHLVPVPRPTGDLSLLAGSLLRLTVTSSSAIKSGTVQLAGLETDLPLSVDPVNHLEAHAAIPIPRQDLTGFSIRLVDVDGIPSRETALYRIDIVPDRPPVIKLTHPGPEEAATAAATELIAFQAVDDFGVARVFLHYIVNHGEEKSIEFDLAGAIPRLLDRRFDWNLAALKLAPGGIIEYWMEAMDANDVTGPGRGLTERARIKIVTDDEKRAELAERTDDTLGSLDDVSRGEDEAAARLGAQIFQKGPGRQ